MRQDRISEITKRAIEVPMEFTQSLVEKANSRMTIVQEDCALNTEKRLKI